MSDPIYRQILSSSFCSCTAQPGCDLIGICVYLCTFVIFSAIKITAYLKVEGNRGAGNREIKDGCWRESGEGGAGCLRHVRAGGRRRMRDIKFF